MNPQLAWVRSITPRQVRSEFSSNAVLAITAVMITDRGLYKSGVTERIASFILQVAGTGRRQIISTISVTVGLMSGLMQNLGAATLFLSVMTGISRREKISISSLLMPMGFAALLGGTLTMVGTSFLIVLNDPLTARGIQPFGLFSALPIGLVLLRVGIGYFSLLGPYVLPSERVESESTSPGQKLLNVWGLSDSIYTFRVPGGSSLIGQSAEESQMGPTYDVNLLEVYDDERSDYDIWDQLRFRENQHIIVQGRDEDIEAFKDAHDLKLIEE